MDSFKNLSKEIWLQTLNISEEDLLNTIEHKKIYYTKYRKPKPNGYRTIYSIDKNSTLFSLQREIQKNFFRNILLPECVYGFRENYSYIDFLLPHISDINKLYLRLDVKDFFDSISTDYIKNFFKYYIDNEINDEEQTFILNSIIDITTLDGKFIQGAITSPSISNFAFREIDIRILKYCRKLGVCYTRYADDMLFSSTNKYLHSKHFIIAVQSIISDFGFSLNYSKTLKDEDEISLNGYVVGNDIRLSRKKFHRINELIFRLSQSDFHSFKNNIEKYHIKNQLAGYRSLLIQLYRYTVESITKERLKDKILILEKLIEQHFK